MGSRDRVLVAMSGGVDSAVAAARLVDAGLDVVGVTLHLWDYPDPTSEKTRCCAPEDAHDARRVADHLGIAHYTFDRRRLFADSVVAPFVDAYLEGRTPSPCVWCNRSVKMRELLALAERLGAATIATGHYARVAHDEHGHHRLYRGRDRNKDQSYFLYMLRPDELAVVRFPLADSTKQDVRAEAVGRSLPGADKGESQELCFVSSAGYARFVEQRAGERVRPGPILDTAGRILGTHDGIHRFTVGQRRGLGVTLGQPAFVTRIDGARAAVVVGSDADASSDGAAITDAIFHEPVTFPLRAEVQLRSRHTGVGATVVAGDRQRHLIRFDEPARAVSPGQVAVIYDGDRVVGGGNIVAGLASAAEA